MVLCFSKKRCFYFNFKLCLFVLLFLPTLCFSAPPLKTLELEDTAESILKNLIDHNKVADLKSFFDDYNFLYTQKGYLIKQLRKDSELLESKKFQKDVKNTTGNTLRLAGTALLLSGGIVSLAIPGCQAVAVISFCGMASTVSSLVVKEGGGALLDHCYTFETLSNFNIISALFMLNREINMQLDFLFEQEQNLSERIYLLHKKYPHINIKAMPIPSYKDSFTETEFLNELLTNQIFEQENSVDTIGSAETILSKAFLKIAEALEKLPSPKTFKEKIEKIG